MTFAIHRTSLLCARRNPARAAPGYVGPLTPQPYCHPAHMRLPLRQTTDAIADAILAGPADPEAILERIVATLGEQERWQPKLIRKTIKRFGTRWVNLSRKELSLFIASNPDFLDIWNNKTRPTVIRLLRKPPEQRPPVKPLHHLTLPLIPTLSDLATWLGTSSAELGWFADRWRLSAQKPTAPLHHYSYKTIEKRDGRCRLIEIPKSRLRSLQRKILHDLLEQVPPHDAAHGFRKARNILTYAAPHTNRPVVIRMDLANFFTSVPAARVHALLTNLGYPQNIARTLTALCTNRIPSEYLLTQNLRRRLNWQERQQYRTRHLPQGAPTSPTLANLCAYRLDVRLAAFAHSVGATYTRYADDLAFSGGEKLTRAAERFSIQVASIALEEGFTVQPRKTRVMHRGTRQHLAGVVVNQHPNMARDKFDQLKAILTNCVRHGPASQNRENCTDFRAHLAGRIAQMSQLNPVRSAKLKAIFDQILWHEK